MKDWIEIPLSVADKLNQWALWAGVRALVALPGITIYTWKQISRLSLHLAENCERFYFKLIVPLDSLPYGGMAGSKLIEVEAKAITEASFEICTDIVEALEGKHALLIGGSGDGKTTTAMFLAYSVGGTIKVYDADAAADEWLALNVVGRCADFEAIEAAMNADLDELQQRTVLRGEKGSHACDGMDCVTIAEEFPLLVGEVSVAAEWLIKHGKRGRRVKKFVIAIAQNDTVANFGIQGDAGVIDSFRVVRLGKKALAHARKLRNDALVEWLRADRSRVLVDDVPCQLPSYREIQKVIQQGSVGYPGQTRQLSSGYGPATENPPEVPPKATENQGVQPSEAGFSDSPKSLLGRVLDAFKAGKSDDWIAKNIFDCHGGNSYYKAKETIAYIRSKVDGTSNS
jgi:hypothetical protein